MQKAKSSQTGGNNRPRQAIGASLFVTIILVLLVAAATAAQKKHVAQKKSAVQEKESVQAISAVAAGFAESQPARELPALAPGAEGVAAKVIKPKSHGITRHVDPRVKPSVDKAVSSENKSLQRAIVGTNALPAPVVSFAGISEADTVAADSQQGFLPPDTSGAAGPNHYVQAVNSCFRVWDKAGNPLMATTSLASLFGPLGGPCGSSIEGEAIVLYDQLADRWIISELCTEATPNTHQLIAISKTGDPTGSYYLYDFMMPNNKLNDSPHFGVWPDAYYMSDNQFDQAGDTFEQAGVFAFNRAKMLVGDPTASFVYFDTASLYPPASGNTGPDGIGGLLPAGLDGLTPPAAAAPCPFAYFEADEFFEPGDQLRLFDFHVDFTTPANSTFAERAESPLLVNAFDPVTVPDSDNVVPQPAPANSSSYLDAINDRLMFRLAYRNFGSSESLVANHTVNAATNPAYRAGIRFYQVTRNTPSGAWAILEQQTFAGGSGDTSNRWVGSGAMNFQGDLVLGYSVSSTTVFPSISYAAQLFTDPHTGGLAQGEQTIVAGAGSQTDTSGRWGDQSDMTVDPSDDCSFWYTQEYYAVSSQSGWVTRIAKLVPGTLATSPRGTISGTITDCLTGLPISHALVQFTNGYSRATNANGTYSATVPPGTYSATVTAAGYRAASASGLVVNNGGNTPFSTCVSGIVAGAGAVTSDGCNSNGVIDPNETVTVSLALKNTGVTNTASLVATLQSTGGVTSPSAPQNYGVLVAGGAPISKSFTFTAGNLACGATLVATLQLQDGANNLGTVTYNFVTGVLSVALSQNFDGVVAPALPAGWVAANFTGAAPLWVTSTTTPDTTPNAAFVDDPTTSSDKRLDTPTVAITSSAATVSFRNNYNLESTFDGGVLEVSSPNINAGAFTDITDPAVGGSFVSGGYNATMNGSFGSTIGGRQAWTGNSGGYVTTIANLGPNVVGQSIKLRFRMVSDMNTGGSGWRIDTVQVSNGLLCCGAVMAAVPPAVVTAEGYTPANNAPDPGELVTVSLPVVNNGNSNTTSLVGTLLATGGVTNPGSPQNYGVVVGGGSSVARSFTFVASGTCGNNITLSLALQDGTNNLGIVTFTMTLGGMTTATNSFSNTASITIPASGNGATTGAPANPYPSNIVVSGLTGTISKVTVALNGLNHTNPADVDVLLVGPGGQNLIVMSDVIGGTDWVNKNYVLDDAAAGLLPSSGAPVSGTFQPTNYGLGDQFPSPAPATFNSPATAGSATFSSIFNGINPNGTWSLYVVDDFSGDVGTMSGGWAINITTTLSGCSTGPPTFLNGPPPSPVIVGTPYTFTFNATGNPSPTFSLTSGSLPPGLAISSAGVISGTATSGGTGNFPNITVKATNGLAPDATQNFALTTVTRAANYIASFGLAGSDAVLTFDYDHDGLANLLEYGLGMNPTVASLSGLPTVILKDYSGTKYLSMTFHRSSLATDLTYIVQGSSDLVAWTDLGTSVAGGATAGPGFIGETGSAPNFTVEVRDTVPFNPITPNKRFLRLKITSP